MWNGNDDVNEDGKPVELYVPIQGPPRKTNTATQDSHIGGHHSFDECFTPCCDLCGDKQLLIAQLKLQDSSSSNDRYLCVFSCPKEECFGQLEFDKGFSSKGGQGVFKCIEKRVPIGNSSENKAKAPAVSNKSSWYDDNDDGDDNNDDDWGTGGGSDDEVNLEDALAAMESKLDEDGALTMSNKKSSGKPSSSKPSSSSEALLNAFGCYLLKKQDEPRAKKSFLEDEDDVGLSESDEKIRNMLARYMAEEEDEDILAALGGTNIGGSGGKNPGEEDERLSEEDRVLRGFQDRQRRAPRQVIRYANGGEPLWSIPDKNRKSGKSLWNVPKCSCCGGERNFEFQVLPSILAALEVDNYQTKTKTNTTDGTLGLDDLLSTGLNFGSIAVFTCCSASCGAEENEAYLVIQKSVDDVPEKGNSNITRGESMPAPSMAVVEDLDDDADFELDA